MLITTKLFNSVSKSASVFKVVYRRPEHEHEVGARRIVFQPELKNDATNVAHIKARPSSRRQRGWAVQGDASNQSDRVRPKKLG